MLAFIHINGGAAGISDATIKAKMFNRHGQGHLTPVMLTSGIALRMARYPHQFDAISIHTYRCLMNSKLILGNELILGSINIKIKHLIQKCM